MGGARRRGEHDAATGLGRTVGPGVRVRCPARLVPGLVPGFVPGSTPAAIAATPTGSIVVDVAGKVRRPGIATLPLGSRVVDALEAAGGARRGVRLGTLNLARVLTDGEQVVVGQQGVPGVAASAAAAPGRAAGQRAPRRWST